MSLFPVDRTHPPSRIVYRDATRHLTLRPWTSGDVDALVEAVHASLSELRAFMPWAHAHVTITREVQYAHVAKSQADCDRLQVTHDEANVASGRVVDRCGFAFEGVVRNGVAAVPDELRARGYRGTGRHRLYALLPEDLARLDWLAGVRAGMTIDDALAAPSPCALNLRSTA